MKQAAPLHILVVDDDPKVRLLLRRCFEQEGYAVSEAANGQEVDDTMSREDIGLITLDLNLGSDDGLMIARDIRSRSNVPIIMVTGKGDMVDRVVGLELGADDYISKPFHVREVLARVRSVIRRTAENKREEQTEDALHCYAFADWILDLSKLELRSASGTVCNLTTGEFQLLEAFVKHPNRVLSRDQLMDLVKGHDWNPYDRTIDNQIARLRKKIEADPKTPALIKTVRGAGYSFTANVRAC